MLNRYKNLQVLSAKSAEGLVEDIKNIGGLEFTIVAMYGHNDGRHYAYLNVDRPTKVVKKRRSTKKTKTVEQINNELKES